MAEKQIKKADSVIAADSNGTYIIDDYLKFVKGDKKAIKEMLVNISDEDILAAVLEYIAMRSEELKDKVGERSLKQFLKKLDNICDLQGIYFDWQRKKVKLMMIQKATASKWLSAYALEQSELKLIFNSNNGTSYKVADIKKKVNNFD